MNPGLKALLSKEFRRHRSVLIGGAVFTSLPYLLFFFGMIQDRAHFDFRLVLFGASQMAAILACMMAGFFAGNAMAGERPVRSIEFLAYMPVPRRLDLVSRLLSAASLTLGLLLVHSVILLTTAISTISTRQALDGVPIILGVAMSVLAIFGMSWLMSILLPSPVLSAAGGLACVILISILGLRVGRNPVEARDFWTITYPLLAGLLGAASLLAGSIYHLKRKVLE